jgi:hypothetical protein
LYATAAMEALVNELYIAHSSPLRGSFSSSSAARPDPEVAPVARRRRFSYAQKVAFLTEVDRCPPGQLGALAIRVMGQWFCLYLILDVYSRKIVGFEVHATDSSDHAVDLLRRTALAEGIHALPRKPVLHVSAGYSLRDDHAEQEHVRAQLAYGVSELHRVIADGGEGQHDEAHRHKHQHAEYRARDHRSACQECDPQADQVVDRSCAHADEEMKEGSESGAREAHLGRAAAENTSRDTLQDGYRHDPV